MKVKFVHHGISVSNMDVSIEWYRRIFDAEVIFDELSENFGASVLNCRVVIMQADEVQFELFEYKGTDGRPGSKLCGNSITDLRVIGNKHNCYNVDLPEFVRRKVIPCHVLIDNGPVRQGNNWQMFIRDPDNIVIELYDIDGYIRDPHAFDLFDAQFNCLDELRGLEYVE